MNYQFINTNTLINNDIINENTKQKYYINKEYKIEKNKIKNIERNLKNNRYIEPIFKKVELLAYENNVYYKIYGSINTNHFFSQKSDLDVAFFSKNPYQTFLSMKQKIKYKELSKLHYKFENEENTAFKIKTKINGIHVTYMIAPINDYEKFQKKIQNNEFINYYFSFFLYFIKYLYYRLHLIPEKLYKSIKNILYNNSFIYSYKYSFTKEIIE